MRVQKDKFSLVAGDYLSSGAPLRLNPEQPWPIQLRWKDNAWECTPMQGFNVFKLMQVSEDNGYKSPFWLSLRDAEASGGALKEEAQGVNVAAWRWAGKMPGWEGDISPQNVSGIEEPVEALDEGESVVAMRPTVIFNAEECTGISALPEFVKRKLPTKEEARAMAQLIETRGAGCEIRHEGAVAFYNPSLNYISLPTVERLGGEKAYFWALFEQIGHAQASKHHLDLWGGDIEAKMAGDVSFKALYAKMVAAMLAYETGVDALD